ncbi:ATP-binding protein [Anaeromyxobacter oryzae]|nr:ATP-binding protein [Anaeromyxobacter oryzae]
MLEFLQLLGSYLGRGLPAGCLSRDAYVNVDAPEAFCLLEAWTDPGCLETHQASDAHRALRGGIRALASLEGEEVLHPGVPAEQAPPARLDAPHGRPPLAQLLAHDLRSPVASIRALVALMVERLDGAPGLDDVVADLSLVRAECERLAAMIPDLLVESRIERKRLHAARVAVALRALVRDAARLAEPRAAACGAAVEVDVAGAPEVASLDPSLVRRLLDNLASNAVRHVGPGDRIQLAAAAEGDRVRIAVRNTGPEVPERVREMLADARVLDDARAGGERGLGLYVCRLVVEAHAGVFSLVSRAGWSVSFEAVLPLLPAPQRSA